MKTFYLLVAMLVLAGINLNAQNTVPAAVNIDSSTFYNTLDINNIKAGINANGYLFNHFIFSGSNGNGNRIFAPAFEVPKGSGIHAMFASSLWIGGNSITGSDTSLHLAAVRYMQVGDDFWYGPVSNNYNSQYDEKWIHVWKLSLNDIKYHMNHYQDAGYEPKKEIATWPGNGDVANGEAAQLAPYYDKNNNGIYEPMQGDYPLIRGDEAVYFIFNDARDYHTESQGRNMGIEIHGMAYAFNDEADSALWNTVFVHYDIYNRSDTTYYDTYFGNFADGDEGNAFDDYIRSDVKLGAMLAYNGDDFDEDYTLGSNGVNYPGYGDKLPALGIVLLGGPYMDADNIDNPSGGCDESINGLNFGNGVVDDERWGMSFFYYWTNVAYPGPIPEIAPDYYNIMHGNYKDGTHWHVNVNNGEPINFNYWYPGNSDTCHFGTGGIDPGFSWTEENDGTGQANPPGDRKGVITTGPFTFKPGDVQPLDIAYVFARSYDGSNPLDIVTNRIVEAKQKAIDDSLMVLPDEIEAVNTNNSLPQLINVWPNPAHNALNIDCHALAGNIHYKVYTVTGVEISNGRLMNNTTNHVNLSGLNNGIYFIYLQTEKGYYYGKFVKE